MKRFLLLGHCFLQMIFVCLISNAAFAVSETKITASDGAGSDHFGLSASISGDIAVVGAEYGDGLVQDSGSAYVFRHNGTTWVEEAKLTASDGAAFDQFGNSVSISGDIVVVGANADDDSGNASGSAYVFRHNGTTWVEEAKLTASDGATGDGFGGQVSISGISGDIVVVGAYGDDSYTGSAYVFRHNGTTWVEEAKLTASDGAIDDRFGGSVAISGEIIVVGASEDDGFDSYSGSAYVFRYIGTTWVEEAKITANDSFAFAGFGKSVSISGDIVVAGASNSTYVFKHNSTTWVEEAKLTANNTSDFGSAVSISGGIVAVADASRSSAYVFRHNGTTWVEVVKLTPSDGQIQDVFGRSISTSDNTVVVGADFADPLGQDSGSAYIYMNIINSPPLANAGKDKIEVVNRTVELDGSGSSDADGDPLTYSWSFVSFPAGSAATFSDPAVVNPTFVADELGTYVVQLIVNDGTEDSAMDTVTVTIVKSKTMPWIPLLLLDD